MKASSPCPPKPPRHPDEGCGCSASCTLQLPALGMCKSPAALMLMCGVVLGCSGAVPLSEPAMLAVLHQLHCSGKTSGEKCSRLLQHLLLKHRPCWLAVWNGCQTVLQRAQRALATRLAAYSSERVPAQKLWSSLCVGSWQRGRPKASMLHRALLCTAATWMWMCGRIVLQDLRVLALALHQSGWSAQA